MTTLAVAPKFVLEDQGDGDVRETVHLHDGSTVYPTRRLLRRVFNALAELGMDLQQEEARAKQARRRGGRG